jgi:acyl-CoA synthetase (NDP forming)
MRLIGPDCFGIAAPGIGLDATFAVSRPRPGMAGLVSQSGGLGIAIADQLSRLGIGISSFASVGDKLDVSSNDMLEMETTALLATQPVPAGPTVAVVSNIGGAAVLAADACADLGLAVHHPHGLTHRRLRMIVPGSGDIDGPVDTTAAVSGADFRRTLELLAADDEVDAMIALVLPTGATGDLIKAVQDADIRVPLAVVVLNQPESVRLIPRSGGDGQVPAYCYPQAAVAAVARAARYGAWRAEPRGHLPGFPDIREAEARALVAEFLHRTPDGGWLPPGKTVGLLHYYGIPMQPMITGGTEVVIAVADHHMFGPLVVFGLGGVDPKTPKTTEVLADHAARLIPLTDIDADKMIRSIHAAPLLLGHRGRPPADLGALRDVLLRVSRLAGDLPEVTALVLNPVIARPDGTFVVAARIKLTPHRPQDPFLRKLP